MSFIWWFLSQRHKYTQTSVIRISRKRVLRVREFCGAVCISKIWFVLTPMLENLLMFQVTSENMTGIRLFKLTATHSRTLNVCDCDCKVKQSKSKNQKKKQGKKSERINKCWCNHIARNDLKTNGNEAGEQKNIMNFYYAAKGRWIEEKIVV